LYSKRVNSTEERTKMKKAILVGFVLVGAAVGEAPGGVQKGPYLIYPGDNTEMMVLWQLDGTQTCTLEWGLDTSYSDGSTITTEYGTDHQHKYVISGLTPGSKYYYQVIVDPNKYAGSFRAALAADVREVKFLGYGDTRTNVFDHDMVDEAMIAVFEEDPNYQTFTLLSGDWVEKGETESSWTNEFFNAAARNTRHLLANLPINGCIGNHEWEDDAYPKTYFFKYWPYPYVARYYWSFDHGPVHIVVLDQESRSYAAGSSQYNWLVEDLASTNKEWKILQLHKPGYSAGGKHDDEMEVQNWIQPLCEEYGVDIVFAGHNHYYARCDVNGVKHITSGGGGAPLRDGYADYSEYVEVYAKTYHFCKIHVRGNDLDFQAVNPDGTVIDAFSLHHPTVELVGPADGAMVDANGAVFSCELIPEAVSYQLLLGPDPQHMVYLVSDTIEPPTETIRTFPFEQTWWTIRIRNQYGRHFSTEPLWVRALDVAPIAVENVTTGKAYGYIQRAIDEAAEGDKIVVGAGAWQHLENIDFKGKNVVVSSTDPMAPVVVSRTVINGDRKGPTVTFRNGEDTSCVLSGLTITNGSCGIYCTTARPTIARCNIVGNAGPGVESPYVARAGRATIINCRIAGNGGDGVWARGRPTPSLTNCIIEGNNRTGVDADERPVISNCTIVGNKLVGIRSFDARISNCIVWGNSPPQIVDPGRFVSVSYNDIQGGWGGYGNISVDPCFVEVGCWDSNGIWAEGDYHLLGSSPCIDAGDNSSVPADLGDLDGDGNTTEPTARDFDDERRFIDCPNVADTGRGTPPIVDMGACEFVLRTRVRMKFTPQALNPGSKGNWVKAHFFLPETFSVDDVDDNTPATLEPFGIKSEYMNVFINDEQLVEIEAVFDRAALCGVEAGYEPVEVIVSGSLTSGNYFYGTGRVKIVIDTLRYLGVLTSHWLEAGCGAPDWCSGFDLDQDSTVNFADFALLDGCCIEIIAE
jgi:hypothetical protein